ncbi:MAG: membrane protein insertion efficiency factor YidD [Flavobacteriales bacterium AspAUS03]
MRHDKKISITPLLMLTRFYQQAVSPWLGPSCRYTPSCSEYTATALKTYGFFRGIQLGFKRIISCHPWGGKGYDPIPIKKIKK